MKDKSDTLGNTKSFGAAPGIDELAREFSVKAPIETRGKLVDQPQEPEHAKEASMAEGNAGSSGITLGQSITMLAVVLAFIAAVFGVSVNAINSSSNARFDDINARFDRLEIGLEERFDGLEAKVDANTEAIASLSGRRVDTLDSSDSP